MERKVELGAAKMSQYFANQSVYSLRLATRMHSGLVTIMNIRMEIKKLMCFRMLPAEHREF
jgi:hypothetical protein